MCINIYLFAQILFLPQYIMASNLHWNFLLEVEYSEGEAKFSKRS